MRSSGAPSAQVAIGAPMIRVLGELEVADLPRRELGSRLQASVLVALALAGGEPLSRDDLVRLLWRSPPRSVVSTLHGYISKVRAVVEELPLRLETSRSGYRLVTPPGALDTHRFIAGYERASEQVAAWSEESLWTAHHELSRALALWRGPALLEFADQPFAEPHRTRLGHLRREAQTRLLAIQLDLGLHDVVVPKLQSLVETEPLREELCAMLLTALYREGRQDDALAVYRRARSELQRTLGSEPSPLLQRVHQAVLRQDQRLAQASTWPWSGAAGARSQPTRLRQPAPPDSNQAASSRADPQSDGFIGRIVELEELDRCVHAARWVTMSGVGGSGKTLLAAELCQQRWAGSHVFIALDGAVGEPAVRRSLAAGFGLRPDALSDDIEPLASAIGDRRLLVCLDGCDQVPAAVRKLMPALLDRCAELHILATCHAPLAGEEEHVWPIPPMSVPSAEVTSSAELRAADAVRLFLDRANSSVARDQRPEALVTVAAICRQLDGLPLAIALAAGATMGLCLDDVSTHLPQALDLLRRSTGPPRQSTLRATLEWSVSDLPDAHRSLLRRLSVFAGPFNLADAEAVCSDDGRLDSAEVAVGLANLVQRSLVAGPAPDDRAPYRLLQTVRLLAAEELPAAGEEPLVRQRHARYFAAVATELRTGVRGADRAAHLRSGDAMSDDFELALKTLSEVDVDAARQLAIDLSAYWLQRSRIGQARAIFAVLVKDHRGLDDRLRVAVLRRAALFAHYDDDFPLAERLVAAGLGVAEPLGCERETVRLLALRAEIIRNHRSNPESAYETAERALDMADQLDDDDARADALRVLTMVRWSQGRLQEARQRAEQWLSASSRCGDDFGALDAQVQLAGLLRDLGDLDGAQRLYRRAHARAEQIGDGFELAYLEYCLAMIALLLEDPAEAERLAVSAYGRFLKLGDLWGQAITLRVRGLTAAESGDFPTACAQLSEARTMLHQRGYVEDLRRVTADLAVALAHSGHVDLADGLCQELLAEGRRDRHTPRILAATAEVFAARGQRDRAREQAQEAMEVDREIGSALDQAQAERTLAAVTGDVSNS